MNCWRIQPLLVAAAEDELPADEARMVQEHLQDCEACAELSAGLSALSLPQHIELPEPALDKVWAQLDAALAPAMDEACAVLAPTEPRRGWRQAVGSGSFRVPRAAAAGYLLCLAALTGWNMHTQSALQELRATQQDILSAPRAPHHAPLIGPPMSGAGMDLQLVDYELDPGAAGSALSPMLLELSPPAAPPREAAISLH